jgi:hypothetical protein
MEKIMSKTNDLLTFDRRPLADSELDAVTGGTVPGLGTMVADQTGDMLGQAIDQSIQWSGWPIGW